MADDKNPSIGGFTAFDALSSMITGGPGGDDDSRKDVNEPPTVDPEEIKKQLADKNEPDEEDDEKGQRGDQDDADDNSTDSGGGDKHDDNSDDDGDDVDDTEDSGNDTSDDSSDSTDDVSGGDVNLGEYESDIMAFLNDKFKEEIGWDISEEDAPKTVAELVKFMGDIVDEASEPRYANDEVKAYDEFVKNGGNLRDFYSSVIEGRVDTENIDIENSFDQKRVLKEHLSNLGYKESSISKKIEKWEEAGILEDEATEALELLKNYNEKQQQKLLETQKKNAELAQQQQQKFISSVEESINSLDNIYGVKISKTEKDELLDYIFKTDNNGVTEYQKEYMSDPANLVKSALLLKKGDALFKKAKSQGNSDAVKNLHDKLKANKGNKGKKGGSQDSGKASSGLSALGSMLQGNK